MTIAEGWYEDNQSNGLCHIVKRMKFCFSTSARDFTRLHGGGSFDGL